MSKFQRVFASLALYISTAWSWEKSQSCQIGNADNKYKVSKSLEYLLVNSTGSIAFQSDFEIFCQSTVKNHVVSMFFGGSYHALISIAGQ